MQTLRITASTQIIEKIQAYLSTFGDAVIESELEVEKYQKDKKYLQKQIQALDAGEVVFYSLNEAEELISRDLEGHANKNNS